MAWQSWRISRLAFFISFVISGILINVGQTLSYLLLVIVLDNRGGFEKINRCFMWLLGSQVVFLGHWWSNSRLVVHVDEDLLEKGGKEKALVLVNHHYEADWMMVWMVSEFFGMAGGAKGFGKRSLRFSPVLGWAWRLSDYIFLARRWPQDEEAIKKGVNTLQNYSYPIWLMLFAEGTRYTRQKFEAGLKYAQQRQLPLMKHHLVPRTKGFVATVSSLDRAKMDALYDFTLVTKDSNASFVNVLAGEPFEAACYVRRYDIDQLPESEKDLANFLMKVYAEKDALKDNFLATGSFTRHGEDARFGEHRILILPKSKLVLAVVSALMLAINLGMVYVVCLLISMGDAFSLSLALLLGLVPAIIMKVMTKMSVAKDKEMSATKDKAN